MKNTEENLPHELVTEILSWLPIKHLCPLRRVSKKWLQLLTKDPKFAKLQFDRFIKSNPSPSILTTKLRGNGLLAITELESCDKALALEYPFSEANSMYSLSGNCNGLLLCIRLGIKEVYIWNPIINDHITVSCLPAPSSRFPGCITMTVFGFGFDQDNDVYKMVRFFYECETVGVPLDCETWTQISVYTIGVDSMWRTAQVDLPRHLAPSSRIIPLNGVLHWHTSRLRTRSCDIIVTFDLKQEVIGELPPPGGIKFHEILELGGLLCVVDRNDVSEIHIWVMKEYGLVSSWSKQYIFQKPQGFVSQPFPFGFADNGEIIMDNRGKLTLYSPQTNTFRDINGFQEAVSSPYAYVGSIISPTVISRVGHNLLEEES